MFDHTRARMLEAMGYQLLVTAADHARPAAQADAALPSPSTDPRSAAAPVPATAAATAAAPPTANESATESAAALPASVVSDDPLWNALLLAAALDPPRAEANGLRLSDSGIAVEYVRDQLWIDPQALRRAPQAKARLWKALRSLRRRERARQP